MGQLSKLNTENRNLSLKEKLGKNKIFLVEEACHDDTSQITGFNRKSSQLINCQLSSPHCLSCRLFSSFNFFALGYGDCLVSAAQCIPAMTEVNNLKQCSK